MINPPIRNLHITIILISITILDPLPSPPPLQITPAPSLTPRPYSIEHHHPTTLNLAR